MKNKRGDVVLVLFPDSNLQTAKRRPALVVQSERLNSGLDQTIVAMITSNQGRSGPAFRINIPMASTSGQQMGLRTDSVIMLDNLATILDSEIDRKIGECSEMQHVDFGLNLVFDL